MTTRPLRAPGPAAALVVAVSALPLAAWGCALPPEAGVRLEQGPVQMAWRTEPDRLAVGRPFVLLMRLCPADARLVRVDATMPEHRHGMNYRPTLLSPGPGRWRAEGLLWHMAGRWEWTFEIEAAGGRHVLRQSVQLP
jgi:hypothetical protein